ncbi:MAG: glycoside hydrolase family 5 protein [Lachnospiraceae bacterium]|nr:glycoside hydrolase family 5 protein [Lachnospiraceae bacterium]
MKKIKYLACIAAVLLLGGCGGEKENQEWNDSAKSGESREESAEETGEKRLQVRVGSKVPDAFLEEEEMEGYEKREYKTAENPMLRADGKVLRDNAGQGEVVQLRGTNAGGYLLQEFWMTTTKQSENVYAEEDIYAILEERFGKGTREELVALYQDHYWTEDDFDYCQQIGMNCIRLPFWYRNLVDENGEFYENWSSRLDWFVEEAGKRGIYVILDMHGAPGSQSGSDHSGRDGREEKEKASEFFFGENAQANQELYYRIWETVAEHFQDNPWVAAYDLLNEAYSSYRYEATRSAEELHQLLWDIYDTTYRKIRQIDRNHVIIMEAVWFAEDLPDPGQYGWENVMYEYHHYYWGDYDNLEGKQVEDMRGRLNDIRRADYDVPGYLGEFTFFNNLKAWEKALKLVDDYGLSWTTWTYKTTEGNSYWGIRSQKNANLNLETATIEEIREAWSAVGQSKENTGLRLVLEKFYRRVYIPAQ